MFNPGKARETITLGLALKSWSSLVQEVRTFYTK